MKTNEYMEQTEQYVLHTYNRFPLVIDHGEGVHLYDTDGKAYLDFAAGIAVYALGYSNDDYKKAVKDQVDKVIHVSNLFYNVPMGSAAEKLAKASGMDKVFFTNSGTESIEPFLPWKKPWSAFCNRKYALSGSVQTADRRH